MAQHAPAPDYAFFEGHANVIGKLVPQVKSIAVLDPRGTLIWWRGGGSATATGSARHQPSPARINNLIASARARDKEIRAGMRLTPSRRVALLTLSDSSDPRGSPGTVVIGVSPRSTLPPTADLRRTLGPVLTDMGRELGWLQHPHSEIDLLEQTQELEWLLEAPGALPSGPDHDELPWRVLSACIKRLGCTLGALWLPQKHLRLVRTATHHCPREAQNARAVLGDLETAFLQAGRSPLHEPDRPWTYRGFTILTIPIFPLRSQCRGLLIFLRSSGQMGFSRRQIYLGQHLGRHMGALLETQFDAVTGLLTRAALLTQVHEWANDPASETHDTRPRHAVIHLDIDRLQWIKETYGAEVGDGLTAQLAQLLKPGRLHCGGLAARVTDSAFVMVLRDSDARVATEEARRILASAHQLDARLARCVSVSCGIAGFSDPATEFTSALTVAQVACETARSQGTGRIEVLYDTLTLKRLRESLREDRLELYAQKIIPLQQQAERPGYELLLRSAEEPNCNRAPAALFFAAQRYQMESAIDDWVIEHAIAQAARYRNTVNAEQIALGVNISAQSLVDVLLLKRARQWIRQSRISPGLIFFEITEQAAISNHAKAIAFIRELRDLGCRFALDDFGTGANSLKVLTILPVDRIKIDGSFVTNLLTSTQSVAAVRAIVSLARDLGITTVAEYAENPELVMRLQELGVDYAQGYGVELPRPLADILKTLEHRTFPARAVASAANFSGPR